MNRSRLICPPAKANGNRSFRQRGIRNSRGQIVVEYVLLLAIAVSVAALITRMTISQRPGESGFIISVWQEVLSAIGTDRPDDVKAKN